MKLAIYGDPHSTYTGDQGGLPSSEVHPVIVNQALIWAPTFVLGLGDHIHGPTVGPAWPTFQDEAGPLLDFCPNRYMPAFGNHDAGDGDAAYTTFWSQRGYPNRYYSVDLGPVGLVVLNVYNPSEVPPNCTDYSVQQAFLQSALSSFAKKPFRVVAYHRSAYSTGYRGSDVCARNAFKQICEDHKVQLVISGHTHAYERFVLSNVQYVTTGGAGGFPHDLDTSEETPFIIQFREAASNDYHWMKLSISNNYSATALLQAVNLEGIVIDEVTLNANPVPVAPKPRTGLNFTE